MVVSCATAPSTSGELSLAVRDDNRLELGALRVGGGGASASADLDATCADLDATSAAASVSGANDAVAAIPRGRRLLRGDSDDERLGDRPASRRVPRRDSQPTSRCDTRSHRRRRTRRRRRDASPSRPCRVRARDGASLLRRAREEWTSLSPTRRRAQSRANAFGRVVAHPRGVLGALRGGVRRRLGRRLRFVDEFFATRGGGGHVVFRGGAFTSMRGGAITIFAEADSAPRAAADAACRRAAAAPRAPSSAPTPPPRFVRRVREPCTGRRRAERRGRRAFSRLPPRQRDEFFSRVAGPSSVPRASSSAATSARLRRRFRLRRSSRGDDRVAI